MSDSGAGGDGGAAGTGVSCEVVDGASTGEVLGLGRPRQSWPWIWVQRSCSAWLYVALATRSTDRLLIQVDLRPLLDI